MQKNQIIAATTLLILGNSCTKKPSQDIENSQIKVVNLEIAIEETTYTFELSDKVTRQK